MHIKINLPCKNMHVYNAGALGGNIYTLVIFTQLYHKKHNKLSEQMSKHTHTHMHARTYARTHAHMHACTLACMHAHIHTSRK